MLRVGNGVPQPGIVSVAFTIQDEEDVVPRIPELCKKGSHEWVRNQVHK